MSVSNRIGGGLLLGLGIALSVIGFMDSRYAGQRALYIVAGLLFVVAGLFRLRRSEAEQR
jgi:hypothetical protein